MRVYQFQAYTCAKTGLWGSDQFLLAWEVNSPNPDIAAFISATFNFNTKQYFSRHLPSHVQTCKHTFCVNTCTFHALKNARVTSFSRAACVIPQIIGKEKIPIAHQKHKFVEILMLTYLKWSLAYFWIVRQRIPCLLCGHSCLHTRFQDSEYEFVDASLKLAKTLNAWCSTCMMCSTFTWFENMM